MKKPLPYKWDADHTFKPPIIGFEELVELYYRRAMDACWLNEGLPKDPEKIAPLCRHHSPSEFKKKIWPQIECFFYLDTDGKYQNKSLFIQKKSERKIRKANRDRVISRWLKEKESIPTVYRTNSEEIPVDHQVEPIQAETLPIGYQQDTEEIPAVETTIGCPAPTMPTEFPTDTEPIPPVKEVSNETKVFAPHFDEYAAWLQFAELYPEKGLIKNKLAMDTFISAIQRQIDYEKLLRSLSNYQAQIGKPGFREPEPFLDWFAVWPTWEDWDTMPQNQSQLT